MSQYARNNPDLPPLFASDTKRRPRESAPVGVARLQRLNNRSEFVRLNGRLGWLAIGPNDRAEFHTYFETLILPFTEAMFAEVQPTAPADLRIFQAQRDRVRKDLTDWYDKMNRAGISTGD